MPTVVIGMSGGVDSSVSALLLKEQGHHVIGMFMKNWEEKNADGVCTSAADYEDVVRVCEQIDIPYYSVNFAKEYWDNVFEHFLADFRAGYTPNPDVLCNREIKFKALLEKAKGLGADYLATGHYCQNDCLPTGEHQLKKGSDPNKDQSYFLHTLTDSILKDVLFPIGNFPKGEVRRIAKKYGLSTAEKKDSTGICFIGKRDFKEFLSGYLPITPGNFEDLHGNIIGRHDGTAYYTLGQRKGLRIGGAGEAWFVVGKDVARNVVIVAQGETHPALYCNELIAKEISWVSPKGLPSLPYKCSAKVRYRQTDQPCIITQKDGDSLHVHFDAPQRAVTAGQAIVFYDGDICLGGGRIHLPGKSLYEIS